MYFIIFQCDNDDDESHVAWTANLKLSFSYIFIHFHYSYIILVMETDDKIMYE